MFVRCCCQSLWMKKVEQINHDSYRPILKIFPKVVFDRKLSARAVESKMSRTWRLVIWLWRLTGMRDWSISQFRENRLRRNFLLPLDLEIFLLQSLKKVRVYEREKAKKIRTNTVVCLILEPGMGLRKAFAKPRNDVLEKLYCYHGRKQRIDEH